MMIAGWVRSLRRSPTKYRLLSRGQNSRFVPDSGVGTRCAPAHVRSTRQLS